VLPLAAEGAVRRARAKRARRDVIVAAARQVRGA